MCWAVKKNSRKRIIMKTKTLALALNGAICDKEQSFSPGPSNWLIAIK